jgi:twitching motility protein PilT
MNITQLIQMTVKNKASDLHIRVMNPPILRIDGKLIVRTEMPVLTTEDIKEIITNISTPEQLANFYQHKELDSTYSFPGVARFRINIMMQRGSPSIAFRAIPEKIPTIDELGLPQILKKLILKPRGLVLVTGPTGTGKSTTMAAMLDYLNDTESRNIVTIEEPIEFLHKNKKSIIVQREVGNDTESFAMALTRALRHDPDVIVVGEMRDLPTIATAITAAETGHLVLATLHTYNAAQSVDRVIDVFPPDQQEQVRYQVSQVIEAVLSQTLVTRLEGGRTAAFEIMTSTPAIRNLIRDNKAHQVSSVIETSSLEGMQTLDQALADLVKKNIITKEVAIQKVLNLEGFEQWLKSPITRMNSHPSPNNLVKFVTKIGSARACVES